ncbi:MAG: SUMF1/EgtB/PvdO family nonheme iron enzyme [Spirochaetes bacterium]|nr:SUMF1/EgtB/PvdO family nonheme iron enzyme [Spirochaetota bacterium]
MKKLKLSALLVYAGLLVFSACGGGGGGGSDDPGSPGADKTISISVINGVTPPACGETPVSIITANEQFTGTVTWNESPSTFAANKVYTATIELTAKTGYTLEGVSDNFFTVSGASVVVNDADSGTITAEFPATGSAPPTAINIKAISGVIAPVRDAVPLTAITETAQYTGTIAWSGSPAKFAASTVYTATITLTAKTGYTFNGISANYFTLSGTTSVTNSANSGLITAVFLVTDNAPCLTEVIVGSATTITFLTGTEFKMIMTPDIPMTNTFPTGTGDASSANVPARFIMGETEVTYQLWKEVYDWATSSGRGAEKYTFANAGVKGNDGAAAKTVQQPVTTVNWRDSIVWCNALTEYYNAYNNDSETDLVCVYTYSGSIIRNSSDSNAIACDGAVQNSSAKGFRLPGSMEWEYAARYRGADTTNTVTGYNNPCYTKGNSISGETKTFIAFAVEVSEYAVYLANAGGTTSAVKTKKPNAIGFYDMSGNVWEWCFDLNSGSSPVVRGGAYNLGEGTMAKITALSPWEQQWRAPDSVQVGFVSGSNPYNESHNMGFRFCRNR